MKEQRVKTMEHTALFPGSFDPFSLGHKAVVEKGLAIFDRIVIAIGVNTAKSGLMTPARRVEFIERVFEGEPRVEVVMYEGLTGDFCRKHGIRHIVRGVRNCADFEYEHSIEMATAAIYPEITTVAVFTPARYAHVSSHLVREIMAMGGDASAFLPEGINVKEYL